MDIRQIRAALGEARFSTFVRAAAEAGLGEHAALHLYEWNATASAAFLVPAHLAEVVLRNAVAEAIGLAYGPWWIEDGQFRRSLPADVRRMLRPDPNAVAETPFAFWEHMVTTRYLGAVWGQCFRIVFPGATVGPVRGQLVRLHDLVRATRRLRNRIAHHEPIFGKDLLSDLTGIEWIVGLRGRELGAWVRASHDVRGVLARRPVWLGNGGPDESGHARDPARTTSVGHERDASRQ